MAAAITAFLFWAGIATRIDVGVNAAMLVFENFHKTTATGNTTTATKICMFV